MLFDSDQMSTVTPTSSTNAGVYHACMQSVYNYCIEHHVLLCGVVVMILGFYRKKATLLLRMKAKVLEWIVNTLSQNFGMFEGCPREFEG